jgi:hypothetical protein
MQYVLWDNIIKHNYTVIIVNKIRILISNFRRVLNVAFFFLGGGDFSVSEFYVPTFRNTL